MFYYLSEKETKSVWLSLGMPEFNRLLNSPQYYIFNMNTYDMGNGRCQGSPSSMAQNGVMELQQCPPKVSACPICNLLWEMLLTSDKVSPGAMCVPLWGNSQLQAHSDQRNWARKRQRPMLGQPLSLSLGIINKGV